VPFEDDVVALRMLARLARALLEAALPLPKPIRLMGLTLSNLEGAEDEKPARDEAQLSLL